MTEHERAGNSYAYLKINLILVSQFQIFKKTHLPMIWGGRLWDILWRKFHSFQNWQFASLKHHNVQNHLHGFLHSLVQEESNKIDNLI